MQKSNWTGRTARTSDEAFGSRSYFDADEPRTTIWSLIGWLCCLGAIGFLVWGS